MAASDPARKAIELEDQISRLQWSYESAERQGQYLRRTAFDAIRAREELEARHQNVTQALEEARHHE